MNTAAAITSWIWLALEVALKVRDRVRGTGSTALDQRTRLMILLLMFPAIFIASVISGVLPGDSPVRFPGSLGLWETVGVLVMWAGLALRVWAITVLGSSFRTTVEVHSGQTVVDRGPYHWVRHPSYSGILLITLGYGLAADNWLSLLMVTLIPAYGLIRRIKVEEKVLVQAMGHSYIAYSATTKRLVPGVW